MDRAAQFIGVVVGLWVLPALFAAQPLASDRAFVRIVEGASADEARHAVVIGNSAYASAPLSNPANDATDVANALRRSGFEVIHRANRDLRGMIDDVRTFGERLKQGGVGLFYYAGHGTQVKGANFLIPIGANVKHEDEVKFETFELGRVLEKMASAGNRLNIVILDACRDNPFPRSFRSSARGLAEVQAPLGTLIAYATAAGRVAADGKGRNGTFTKHLLEHMETPGLEIGHMFRQVRTSVRRETRSRQIPWESSSLEGRFYFVAGEELPPPASVASASFVARVKLAEPGGDGVIFPGFRKRHPGYK